MNGSPVAPAVIITTLVLTGVSVLTMMNSQPYAAMSVVACAIEASPMPSSASSGRATGSKASAPMAYATQPPTIDPLHAANASTVVRGGSAIASGRNSSSEGPGTTDPCAKFQRKVPGIAPRAWANRSTAAQIAGRDHRITGSYRQRRRGM